MTTGRWCTWHLTVARTLGSLCCAASLCIAGGCGRSPKGTGAEPAEVEPFDVPAPAPLDRGAFCADVGALRVCWDAAEPGASCASGVCIVDRPLPAPPAFASGWRCHGQGEARSCVRRDRGGGPFVCSGGVCTQAYARAPDDGAWICADIDGVVVCSGGEPPAGAVPGPADAAFVCGTRRTSSLRDTPKAAGSAGLCVDLAPDMPDEAMLEPGETWSCRYDYSRGGSHRVCEKARRARMGAACDPTAKCPAGALCVSGRCVPTRPPRPECWLDDDCPKGQLCRLATCTASGP